jgi:flavin reductase (DIM6/NTAB) family NADH-FMN oxidoreductase RutF
MTHDALTADFVQAMGQHVSSVCVITTSDGNRRFGLTATAVSSVCATPPRLLVCVNKSGLTHEKTVASGHFGVNVLAEDQLKIGQMFAGMMGKDVDRFAFGQWRAGQLNSPLLTGAAACFECRIATTLDQSTHSIFIGDVVEATSGIGVDALLYGARRFRTLRRQVSLSMLDGMETLHF